MSKPKSTDGYSIVYRHDGLIGLSVGPNTGQGWGTGHFTPEVAREIARQLNVSADNTDAEAEA